MGRAGWLIVVGFVLFVLTVGLLIWLSSTG